MSAISENRKQPSDALDRLAGREEILQICYWYEGEGFGTDFTASALGSFLNEGAEAIETALAELETRGHLRAVAGGYRFTEGGRREAGKLFAETFADFQRPAHGECEDGCCDDDHSQCGQDCPYH